MVLMGGGGGGGGLGMKMGVLEGCRWRRGKEEWM